LLGWTSFLYFWSFAMRGMLGRETFADSWSCDMPSMLGRKIFCFQCFELLVVLGRGIFSYSWSY
jgi:hypothetical protein